MAESEQDYLLPDEWNGRVVYFFNEATGTMLDLGAGQSTSPPSDGCLYPLLTPSSITAQSWNGNPVIGWEFTGSGAQQWRLEKVDSGPFGAWVLRNVAAGSELCPLSNGDDGVLLTDDQPS